MSSRRLQEEKYKELQILACLTLFHVAGIQNFKLKK